MMVQSFLTTVGFASKRTTPVAGERPSQSAAFDGVNGTDLIKTSATSLYLADTDTVIIGGWVKYTDNSIASCLMAMHDVPDINIGGNWSYRIENNGDGTFNFASRKSLLGHESVDSTSAAIANNQKAFFLAWKDTAAKTVNVKINNAALDSSDYTGTDSAFITAPGDFLLGGDPVIAASCSAALDELFVCKNPANLAAALSTINTTIYNAGTGLRYEGLTAQQKIDIGLVSWWGLDETSGTRFDLHGTNDMTVEGNVTAATALVS